MAEKHKNIITSKYEELVNLNADRVMVTLIAQGMITFEDQDDINSEKTRTKKVETLLALLLNKQDHAYHVLIDALKNSGSPDLCRDPEKGRWDGHCRQLNVEHRLALS